VTTARPASRAPATRLRLLLIVGLALVVRLAAARVVGDSRVPWNYEYEEIARNLLTTGHYAWNFYGLTQAQPTAFIPPVYPLLLALAGWIRVTWALTAIQILLSLGTVVAVYGLSLSLRAREEEALTAGLLTAIYPPLASYAVTVSTVTLEALFLVLGSWLLVLAGRRLSLASALGGGAALAAAGLTRSTWLALLSLAFVWVVWYPAASGLRHRLVLGLSVLLGAALVCLPWAAYNLHTFGVWSISSTNGGLNFWIGNNPQATGEYVFPTEVDRDLVLQSATMPEFERDQFFYARGLQAISAAPWHAARQYALKLFYYLFFRPNIGSNYTQAGLPIGLAQILFISAWLACLPLAIFCLTRLGRGRREHSWLALATVSQALMAALFFVGTRFRTPLDVFFLIWAAIGLVALWRKFRPIRQAL
jgi:4-amino-4-deoxy-L-arabinose transferase-like glycosyltransferase